MRAKYAYIILKQPFAGNELNMARGEQQEHAQAERSCLQDSEEEEKASSDGTEAGNFFDKAYMTSCTVHI